MPYWSCARKQADSSISSTKHWHWASFEQCSRTLYHMPKKNWLKKHNKWKLIWGTKNLWTACLTCITRQPYGCVASAGTWPLKEDNMNPTFSVGRVSIHFWITWFPFWSCTHFITCPSSSFTSSVFWSTSIASSA